MREFSSASGRVALEALGGQGVRVGKDGGAVKVEEVEGAEAAESDVGLCGGEDLSAEVDGSEVEREALRLMDGDRPAEAEGELAALEAARGSIRVALLGQVALIGTLEPVEVGLASAQ